MKRYISDQHFFSKKVMEYMDKRPFGSVEEMNAYMIAQWNDTVKGGDQIYVLGDMFDWRFVEDAYQINHVLHKLQGKLYLICGNHDAGWINRPGIDRDRFVWIDSMREIDDGPHKVIMNHFPMPVFGGNHLHLKNGDPMIWDLYGHVHDTAEAQFIYDIQEMGEHRMFTTAQGVTEPMRCNMINCFCMYSDYRPLSLNEWIAMHERRIAARVAKSAPSDENTGNPETETVPVDNTLITRAAETAPIDNTLNTRATETVPTENRTEGGQNEVSEIFRS